jgi:hypothetical protein
LLNPTTNLMAHNVKIVCVDTIAVYNEPAYEIFKSPLNARVYNVHSLDCAWKTHTHLAGIRCTNKVRRYFHIVDH